MVSELDAINIIGKFSKENMRFISSLKKNGMWRSNEKIKRKHVVEASWGDKACTVIFDYNDLDVKTKGNKELCSNLTERIRWTPPYE